MKGRGVCIKCKAPILVVTDPNQLFCGVCWKDMNEQIKSKRISMGKDTKGKALLERGMTQRERRES